MHSKNRPRSVTQADVASHAGVSQALVSIVFRNHPGASPQNRERVLKAAEELGYRRDQRARLLAANRSGAIGVSFLLGHEFHAGLIAHLYDAAEHEDYELLLGGATRTHTEAEVVRSLTGFRCEALIMLAPCSSVRALESLAEGQPVIVVSRALRSDAVDTVCVDEVAGARLATQHLIDLGHSHIAHVHGGGSIGAAERRTGYLAAMREAGLEAHIDLLAGGLVDDDGERTAAQLLERPLLPTGIVAFNDHCAAGLIGGLRDAGVRVPQDVSIVGFDNAGIADLATVQLSTVSQNAPDLARLAMRRALARIAGDEPVQTIIRPQLVTRRSTAAPAAG